MGTSIFVLTLGVFVRRHAYLVAGRLQDVLALIQVLGVNQAARRSERQLMEILQCKPTSGVAKWSEVAMSHPEFFRVAGQSRDSVCLVARHAAGGQEDERILPPDFIEVLTRL